MGNPSCLQWKKVAKKQSYKLGGRVDSNKKQNCAKCTKRKIPKKQAQYHNIICYSLQAKPRD